MKYWLMKTEPSVFSINNLEMDRTAVWDGVRNYQARNYMRQMKKKDSVFIYHSNCKEIGIAGLAEILEDGFADPTQFNPKSPYFDAKTDPQNPRWTAVKIEFKMKFKQILTLGELKQNPLLKDFQLIQKGNRLSVLPISDKEYQAIMGQLRA